jgi:DnaK suppressor protein
MAEHQALRTQLESRLRELTRRVGKIEGDLRQPGNPDWEERGTERENDEVLEGLDQSGRAELRQIRAALSRMETGTYGVCEGCGEAIDGRRLEVVPYASSCVGCAS